MRCNDQQIIRRFRMHAHMRVTHVHIHTRARTRARTHASTHTHTHTRTRTHTHTHTHTTCSYACMQVHTCRQAKWRKGGTAPSSMRLPCLIAFTPHTGTPYHKCCNRQPTTRMSTPCPSAGGNRLRLAYTYGTAGAGSARGCLQPLEPFGSPFRHDVEL